MSQKNIKEIQEILKPWRDKIVKHEVYNSIKNLDDISHFMSYHVYAVWDFMSLLKALQQQLTCVSIPWYPVGSADTRFLINEIVVGEESDIDENGRRKSHFEMYLDAISQCEGDTIQINTFLESLMKKGNLDQAFNLANTPAEARDFVNFTFQTIATGEAHKMAAVFTFGREDLIPGMFYSMVNNLHISMPEKISKFKYYLDRHIEVDGDHHSHLALEMLENLCGEDEQKWFDVKEISIQALQMRLHLWDGVHQKIGSLKSLVAF
ncbi:MAG: DUF3050 domain-containing protein [Bacteroidia bacterium]|nr:DUF3050 domain-containing protein [Bacteroidia bacterium]